MKKVFASLLVFGMLVGITVGPIGCGGEKEKKKGETTTKPADTKPADTKPADTKPADTKPAEKATKG